MMIYKNTKAILSLSDSDTEFLDIVPVVFQGVT